MDEKEIECDSLFEEQEKDVVEGSGDSGEKGIQLKSPFPWFGGKSRVAPVVWKHFGNVSNYVEPFAGSLAVLLNRPTPPGTETINDKDAYLSNFWRAVCHDAEAVAAHADYPVHECELFSRHKWLINDGKTILERLKDDPEFYDVRIAGWWVWGLSAWIGSGWCFDKKKDDSGQVSASMPYLKSDGQGIHRKNTVPTNQMPQISNRGVHSNPTKKIPRLGNSRTGVHRKTIGDDSNVTLREYFLILQQRLRKTRVCSGDWSRVMGPSVTFYNGMTGVFLDPPYDHANRDKDIYGEDENIASSVRKWAIDNGDNKLLRIALCGYSPEFTEGMPEGWTCHNWKAVGGYGSQSNGRARDNAGKEVIWFSKACITPQKQTMSLFSQSDGDDETNDEMEENE